MRNLSLSVLFLSILSLCSFMMGLSYAITDQDKLHIPTADYPEAGIVLQNQDGNMSASGFASGEDVLVSDIQPDMEGHPDMVSTPTKGYFLVAESMDTGNNCINIFRSTDGKNWWKYFWRCGSGSDILNPSIAVPEKTEDFIYVVYEFADQIQLLKINLNDGVWTTHTVVPASSLKVRNPRIVTDGIVYTSNYYLYVAYDSGPGPDNEHWANTIVSADRGITWGSSTRFANISFNNTQPDITWAGNLYVTWTGESSTLQKTYISLSANFGSTWSSPADLCSYSAQDCTDPRVAAINGADEVVVTYTKHYGSDLDVWYAYSTDGGSTWSLVNCLSCSSSRNESNPDITVDPSLGDFHVAFWDNYDIKYSHAAYTGPALWSSPELVNDTNQASVSYLPPAVAVHWASGEAGVAWSDFRTLTYAIYFDRADKTAPSGTISINSGAVYTASAAVALSLSCIDNWSGCYQMRFSNEGAALSDWEPYAAGRSWSLSSGEGNTHTVYAQFKDRAGNESALFSIGDNIILDAAAPTDGTLLATAGDAQVSLDWTGFSDATSGIVNYKLVYSTTGTPGINCTSGNQIYYGAGTSYPHSALINGTPYYYRVCAVDNAQNTSSGAAANATPRPASVSITIDSSPSGRQITVDGVNKTAPQTVNWTPGSSHTIGTSSPQSGGTGIQYVYSSWSDGLAQTHNITTPSSEATYTANFITQYQLTTSASPTAGGGVSPSCPSGCWYNSDTSVAVTATANTGYAFTDWSDACSGTGACNVLMNAAWTVSANFCQLNTYYRDSDEDYYGNPSVTRQECTPPSGYLTDKTDCDDTNRDIHPGVAEICDSKDNNCNGQSDDGIAPQPTGCGIGDCSRTGWKTCLNGIWGNDTCLAGPPAEEMCDGRDNDCDGQTDEGVPSNCDDGNPCTQDSCIQQNGTCRNEYICNAPLTPADFSASADRINFDNLSQDVPLTFQLMTKGVRVYAGDNSLVNVVDSSGLAGGNIPVSLPNAVKTGEGATLQIDFLTLRKKTGFYFMTGHISASFTALLRAYGANGQVIGTVAVIVPNLTARSSNTYFIGIGFDDKLINRITFEYVGSSASKIIDDLLVDPPQEINVSVGQAEVTLLSSEASQDDKLAAIDSLQLMPSEQASEILQTVASADADFYVRERAIMALTQVRDPEAIPALVEIGLNPPSSDIRIAAYNAVWALRQLFPLPDPPVITIQAITPIQLGQEFDVEARIISPVDREFVQVAIGSGKLLTQIKSDYNYSYKGPLTANEPITLRSRFIADEIGMTSLKFTMRINIKRVDGGMYRVPLYIDIQQDGGSASMTMFPGTNGTDIHVIPIE
jgi:hypothetical protein